MIAPRLLSLACVTPRLRASQEDLLAHALRMSPPSDPRTHDRVCTIYRNAGVQTRGIASDLDAALTEQPPTSTPAAIEACLSVLGSAAQPASTGERMQAYQQRALPLALRAAQVALRDEAQSHARMRESGPAGHPADNLADNPAHSITHLVTATCTGFGAPGWEAQLPALLGLPAGVLRTHIGFMGCHAAINALRVAHAFALSAPSARVLVCCAEVCSLHYQPQPHEPAHTERAVANALFADGAAAAIVGSSDAPRTLPTLVASASTVFPGTHDHMSWRIRDHGFAMTLSPVLPRAIRALAGPWLSAWLTSQGVHPASVEAWCIHPGGPNILLACEAALGLTPASLQSSREVLASSGNMSSPTVLFVLQRELQRLASAGRTGPIVLLSFGPGVAAEAMLLRA